MSERQWLWFARRHSTGGFTRRYSVEIYGALIAALFAGVGTWFGLTFTKEKIVMDNPIMRPLFIFIKPFPMGLLVTLISAAVLRRK